MDVTSTQGAQPAATPTAPADAAPSSLESFQARLSGEDDYAESSTADAVGDQDPQQEPEAEATGAEPDKKKAEEDGAKTKTEQRFQKLLKERASLREEMDTLRQTSEAQSLRLSLALQRLVKDNAALKQQLSAHVDIDSPEYQLEALRNRQQTQAEFKAEQRKLEQRLAKERETSMVEEARAELFDLMDEALASYPNLTRDQLQARFREHAAANSDVTFETAPDVFRDLAAKLDEEIFARYEPRILERHKAKLSAPQPISTRGTVSGPPSRLRTVDEMADDAEAAFGATWGNR